MRSIFQVRVIINKPEETSISGLCVPSRKEPVLTGEGRTGSDSRGPHMNFGLYSEAMESPTWVFISRTVFLKSTFA